MATETVTTTPAAGPPATVSVAATPTPSIVHTTVGAMTDSVVETTTHSPGWKTSEGLLAFAATFLSGLFGAGVIPTSGAPQMVAVVAAIALTSLGYSVSRGLTKAAP